jgi:hypothetical protein
LGPPALHASREAVEQLSGSSEQLLGFAIFPLADEAEPFGDVDLCLEFPE